MSVDEPSELLKSVADARAVEGPALSVDESGELKSVSETRSIESPQLSVDEPSELQEQSRVQHCPSMSQAS